MNSTQLTPVIVPFTDDSIKLVNVNWSDQSPTRIELRSKRTNRTCIVEFESIWGLRMLGELDLAAIWSESNREDLKASWLFKVITGGWLELESTRDDFYTQHAVEKPIEFLIVGYQECLSLLSLSLPKVYESAP